MAFTEFPGSGSFLSVNRPYLGFTIIAAIKADIPPTR
jgi:hypothetical protein